MEKKDIYDKHDIYEKTIDPIIQDLKMKCNLNHLPMFVTVAVANNDEETTYLSDMIYSSANVRLTEKRIGGLLLLINDFDSEPPVHIQRCIRDLEEYIDKARVIEKKGEQIDVTLKDDKIHEMNGVMSSGDKVRPPKELLEKVLDDEFYADM